MGFLDFLFKKEEEKTEEEKQIIKDIKETPKELKEGSVVCGYCKGEIFSHEKRIKKQKEAFHNKCMKKMKKIAKKRAFG